jgi:SAM-dependent methyltransferase
MSPSLPHTATACRTCGSLDTLPIGRLPDVAEFAGTRLERPLAGGCLQRCGACGFLFRTPIFDDDAYLSLYAQGSPEVWEPRDDREDFRLIRSRVGDAPLDVLDVGCYTGHLLATLPKPCRLYGVEPNAAAAAIAESRGVRVIAGHWHQLASAGQRFDLITACDVIEHFGNPLAFLQGLASLLREDGRLIITTGNAEAWLWRLLKARFWYCQYAEHISFIGPGWLARMGGRASLQVTELQSFSHSRLPPPVRRIKTLLRTVRAFSTGTSLPRRRHAAADAADAANAADADPGPLGAGLTKDHILCVLRRV